MPYIYLKLAFDEPVPEIEKSINPLAEGQLWIRGMDIEPILTTHKEIKKYKQDLIDRKEKIHSSKAHV